MTIRPVLALLAAALVTTACDRVDRLVERFKPHAAQPAAPVVIDPNLPHERAEVITWDDLQGGFMFEGRPLTAARVWRFEDGPQGFTGQGATVSFSPLTGTALRNDVFDSLLRSPDGLMIDGARFNLVLVRLSREANGPPWDGSLYWSNDAHGEVEDFHAKPFLGAAPQMNETVILAYDMARPDLGGADWVRSMVRQFRVDTDDGAGGRFLLRQIAVTQNPAPDRLRGEAKPPVVAPTLPSARLR